ncbi:MAG: SMC-Scp complex subunit ScpB [Parcubacteria group bacterium]|nr:SMC-Scp complex subunit ScpB [Parcubacteria group bacterium]|tara:strand:- start:3159 stop:3719 length:561 start_codon:yes stop_codon:yes gene_type:complete
MLLKSKIESLLFISNQPFTIKKLVSLTKSDKDKVTAAIKELSNDYNKEGRGMAIQKIGDKVQMVTSADNAKLVKDYIKEQTTGELSKAALETLTVIAYRGPISKAELEQVRGVNCGVILRNLLIRGLIESKEDKKKMQTSYNITFDFLKFLGLNDQTELPDFEKLNSNEILENILKPEQSETKEED